MSRAGAEAKPAPTCWDCGATNDTDASECWLCHRRDWSVTKGSRPAKTAASREGNRFWARAAIIIVIGASSILCAGMTLDASSGAYLWLYSLPLAVFVVLMIWSRFQNRPRTGQPMTALQFAASIATIAAGMIVIAWLVRAQGAVSLGILIPFVVLAIVYTVWRAKNRSRDQRPMTVLEFTASVVFLAVFVPPLMLTSLFIALLLICRFMFAPLAFH
jgi:hypothetical protein